MTVIHQQKFYKLPESVTYSEQLKRLTPPSVQTAQLMERIAGKDFTTNFSSKWVNLALKFHPLVLYER